MNVAAILRQKRGEIASAQPGQRLAEVAELLSARRIGAVPVLGPGGRIEGIFSERDIVHALAAHGAAALAMPVAALMTREVTTATPATTVAEAMEMMTAGRFRHLPVMEAGRMVGIVSIGDVVKARIDAQAHEVDSLRAYVAGVG
jgi:CBS domain-containing protein